ncbi:MAG: hypothetical protein BXU00_01860 [Candidatus Nanoclepta minutus]|uniref:Hydrolase TatD n=1 Tax=Candidatus Nanoclepta minutus TaxID=1940235 RepID=A0A397WPC8_9ARCH|nr:MAG: hypothetical protein BXU00_01860 [Candidatus Nanoclepta minutus]
MLIDTHSHLFFYDNIDEKIKENLEKNVKIILENGINRESNRKVIEESKRYDIVYYALGYHPTDLVKEDDEYLEKEIDFIEKVQDSKFLAIGEIGLDFYWIKDDKLIKRQEIWLENFLKLAEKIRKPVILHSRNAELETIEISESYNCKKILHSFWNKEHLKKAIDKGFYISIPAFVYKDKTLQEIAKETPLDLLLTETDAPFLDPIERRNNNSWKIMYGLERISKIRNIEIEELINVIVRNFEKAFNIDIKNM